MGRLGLNPDRKCQKVTTLNTRFYPLSSTFWTSSGPLPLAWAGLLLKPAKVDKARESEELRVIGPGCQELRDSLAWAGLLRKMAKSDES